VPTTLSVPWLGSEYPLILRFCGIYGLSGSLSFAITSRVTFAVISTQIVSFVATGTSGEPSTVMEIVAEDDVSAVSSATNTNESGPL